jgi:hypothetical protein
MQRVRLKAEQNTGFFGGQAERGTARARSSRLRAGEPYQDRNRKGHARCQRRPVFLVHRKSIFIFISISSS